MLILFFFNPFSTFRHEHNISSIAFLPNSDFILSGSRDKLIKLWDVTNGYCVQNFSKHTEWVRVVLVNEEGTYFASCSSDKVFFQIFSEKKFLKSIIVWCLATKTPKATLIGHEHVVEALHWVPEKNCGQILSSEQSTMEGFYFKN